MAYRPLTGDITEALLHYYDINWHGTNASIHKEVVYNKVKQYYINNPDKGNDIAWGITARDPIKEILERHLPAHLHATITARKSLCLSNKSNKVRAFRYLQEKTNDHEQTTSKRTHDSEATNSTYTRSMKKPKINQPLTALDQHTTARTLENTTPHKLNNPTTHTDDNAITRPANPILGEDLPTARTQDFYGENHAGTSRTLRLLELYAGTAPASRFAHRAGSTRVLTVAVDWSADPPDIQVSSPSRHTNVRFDIAQLRIEDITVWAKACLEGAAEDIDWIHASVDCTTFSNASACKATHRRPDGAPRSQTANDADASLGNLIAILRTLKKDRPNRLITIENPENSSFTSHPSVRLAVAEGSFRLLYSHHCSAAAEDMDGPIAGPAEYRCPPVFPKKGSVWLTSGLPRSATLPRCDSQCRMRIPGTNHHKLVICAPSDRQLHEGQRKLTEKASRSRIPLGTFRSILDLWKEALEKLDGFQEACAKCGNTTGEMICCDSTRCDRIEHYDCESLEEIPPKHKTGSWFCQMCRMRSGLGDKDSTSKSTRCPPNSHPGEF